MEWADVLRRGEQLFAYTGRVASTELALSGLSAWKDSPRAGMAGCRPFLTAQGNSSLYKSQSVQIRTKCLYVKVPTSLCRYFPDVDVVPLLIYYLANGV